MGAWPPVHPPDRPGSEEAIKIGTKVVVEGPAGSASDGDLDGDGTHVRQPVKADLPDGKYTVK